MFLYLNLRHMMLSETQLWNGVRNGESAAYRHLYDLYIDRLYSYGRKFMKDDAGLRDNLQDLFVDLYQYRSTLAETANIQAYLFSSLRRRIFVSLKKKATVISTSDDLMADVFAVTFQPDPEQLLIMEEDKKNTLRIVLAELNNLPARQKEVLYLRYGCDMEYEEIAALMRITVPTARTLVYRSVKELRGHFDQLALARVLCGVILFS